MIWRVRKEGYMHDTLANSILNSILKKKDGLPPVTQEVIISVDVTPDREYPLRILKAYRDNCNCLWRTDSPGPLFDYMNKKNNEKRTKILNEAIGILEKYLVREATL